MNRKDLVGVLELVKPALAKENIIPIYQCFCFDEGRVSAYDDRIGIVGPTECINSFATHGNTLLGLLSNSSAEKLEIKFDEHSAEFKLGKTVLNLPTFPKDDFLFTIPKVDLSTVPITVNLIEALKICLETVSEDETQRALQGITMFDKQIYSCNGDMLTRVKIRHGSKDAIMLPTQFCEAVIRLWENLNFTKGRLGYDKDWLCAEFPDWQIWGRGPEVGNLPDFEGWIQKGIKKEVQMQPLPKGLYEALCRARVLADVESQKTEVAVKAGKLEMMTFTHMGDVSDQLLMKDHPDTNCSINAAHLQQAIVHCDQIAFHENCTILEAPEVFIIMGNM